MNPLVLLANPQFADRALALAGYAAGLGDMDVRELSQTRIPVWTVVAGSVIVGLAAGIYVARKLPSEWIVPKHSTR